ncbi:MAG: AAA family ATPase [Spirochaetia bacterium]
MKPRLLSMKAFGPFTGKTEIDFSELCSSGNIFLISGPTGSGKTTVLDAVCYALYGDTSGMDRSGKEMRSDRCKPGDLTEVLYEFELRGRIYRVRRRPEQEKLKLRGEGFTTAPQEAVIWKMENDKAVPLAEKWAKVTETVETLFGMGSSQFRQVVILPQGQFRKLLLAKSNEREAILQTLFKTEYFTRIENKLKEKAREVYGEMHTLASERKGILQSAGAESEEDISKDINEKKDLITELVQELELITERGREINKEFNQAKRIWDRYTDLETAGNRVKELQEKEPYIRKLKQKTVKGKKALNLKDIETAVKETESVLTEKKRILETLCSNEETALKENEQAQANLSRIKDSKDRIDSFTKELSYLVQTETGLRKLEQAEAALIQLETEYKTSREDKIKTEQTITELAATKKKNEQLLVENRKSAAELERLRIGQRAALRRRSLQKEIRELREVLDSDRAELEAAVIRKDKIQHDYDLLNKKISNLLTELRNNFAAALAETLADGKPCPVCGSEHHPKPAETGHRDTETGSIEEYQQTLKDLKEKLKEASELEKEYDRKTAAGESKLEALSEELNEISGDGEAFSLEEIQNRLRGAEEAEATIETLTDENTGIDREIKTSEDHFKTLIGKTESVKTEVNQQKKIIKELEGELPEGIRTLEELTAKKKVIQEEIEQYNTDFKDAENICQKANDHLVSLRASRQAAEETFKSAEIGRDKKRAEFLKRIMEEEFESREEFEASRLTEKEIADLEMETDRYDREYHSINDRFIQLKKDLKDTEKPDLENHAKLSEQIRQEEISVSNRIGILNKEVDESVKRLKILEEKQNDLDRVEKYFSNIGLLSDTASGKNSLKITFHRFVLTALLDDILIAAGSRLSIMSKGRYSLQRYGEAEDKRIQSGLDIGVYDAYTGTLRGVGTLSGGESFLAALSLALGMADVVQGYSGGIQLDTIFVDEGFGSLDPEALEAAMSALVELKARGRIIGIISHVADLRERIETQLRVTPGKNGSTAGFISPYFSQAAE